MRHSWSSLPDQQPTTVLAPYDRCTTLLKEIAITGNPAEHTSGQHPIFHCNAKFAHGNDESTTPPSEGNAFVPVGRTENFAKFLLESVKSRKKENFRKHRTTQVCTAVSMLEHKG